jgi:hypothetical protein
MDYAQLLPNTSLPKKCRCCNGSNNNCFDRLCYPCECGYIHRSCLRKIRLDYGSYEISREGPRVRRDLHQKAYKCYTCNNNYLLEKKSPKWFRIIKTSIRLVLDILIILTLAYLLIALFSFISYRTGFDSIFDFPDSMDQTFKYYLSGSLLLFGIIGLVLLLAAYIASFTSESSSSGSGSGNNNTNIYIFDDRSATAIIITFFAVITLIGSIVFLVSVSSAIRVAFINRKRQLKYHYIVTGYKVLDREDLENIDSIPYAQVIEEIKEEIVRL